MNFLKLTMIDTPSPRDADASKNKIGWDFPPPLPYALLLRHP